jgi:hypothetical protein
MRARSELEKFDALGLYETTSKRFEEKYDAA